MSTLVRMFLWDEPNVVVTGADHPLVLRPFATLKVGTNDGTQQVEFFFDSLTQLRGVVRQMAEAVGIDVGPVVASGRGGFRQPFRREVIPDVEQDDE